MDYRIIGIIGRNFSGSTILSRFFSVIPGVQSVGEIHWLLDAPIFGSVATREGFHVSRHCVVCAKSCPIFTEEFIKTPKKQKTLYSVVAEQVITKTGVHIIVSSDKTYHFYSIFVDRKKMDGIVIFKRPESDAASHIRNEKWSLAQALEGYSSTYGEVLNWAPTFCNNLVFVSYEELVSRPNEYIQVLCEKLAIEFSGNVTDFSNAEYHHIGGNPRARRSVSVRLDNKWKKELSNKQKKIVSSNIRARNVYKELMNRRIVP